MTFADLAAICGLSKGTVANVASGTNTSSRARALISNALGVNLWADGLPQRERRKPTHRQSPKRRRRRVAPKRIRSMACGEDNLYAAGMVPVAHGNPLLHVRLRRDASGTASVTLQQLIGGTADYSPNELRRMAEKLKAIADAADAVGEGDRTFRIY